MPGTCGQMGCFRQIYALGLCRDHLRETEAEMVNLRARIKRLEDAIAELKRGIPA